MDLPLCLIFVKVCSPIDILVLGLQNVDRSELYSSLVRFALQQHLTLTFFMDFEEFSIEKERHLIHDAKVSRVAFDFAS